MECVFTALWTNSIIIYKSSPEIGFLDFHLSFSSTLCSSTVIENVDCLYVTDFVENILRVLMYVWGLERKILPNFRTWDIVYCCL